MIKIFKKLIGVVLGLSMAVGVGVGVTANNKAATRLNATGGTFEKITSIGDLASGEKYLIVSESDNCAFDGSLETIDATSNTISINIVSNKITTTSDCYFTITAKTGGYSIQGAGGKFIGSDASNANELDSSDTDTVNVNTITWNGTSSCFVIRGNNSYLVYNNTSGQTRFRYYKPTTCNNGLGTGSYHKISLFKEATETPAKSLSSIEVSDNSGKTWYESQSVSPTDLSVVATYDDDSTETITDGTGVTITSGNPLVEGENTIGVSYTDGVTTKTGSLTITANSRTLSSISVSGQKTTFTTEDEFSFGGTVTATYDYGPTADVTASATFSGYNLSSVGDQTVTVSYTEKTVTKTTTYDISVGYPKGSLQNPYSVSEALVELAKLSKGTNNGKAVYVRGIVTSVGGSLSNYATDPVTFTIKDLEDPSKTVLAFSIQGGSDDDPTAEYYVEAGYEVLIFGYLINYNNTLEVGYVKDIDDSSGFVSSIAPKYTLAYNANGATSGDLPEDSAQYSKYTEITVADNTGSLEKTDYEFHGWNTRADPTADDATHYDVGETFALTEDTTLYAEWLSTAPSITVQANLSGFTGEYTILDFTYGYIPNAATISVVAADDKVTVGDIDASAGTGSVEITFNTAGNTSLSFQNSGVELATCSVTVNQSTVSITGLPASKELYLGKTLDLGSLITVTKAGSYNTNVTWESSESDIASVNSSGVVTANGKGEAVITVKSVSDPTVSQSCTVTINMREPLYKTWDLSKVTYEIENDGKLVTWSSDVAVLTNTSDSEVGAGGTLASNYLGGDANNRTSSRMYGDNIMTVSPVAGFEITSVVFTATSTNYANTFAGSSWTNAIALASGTAVTVTPTDGTDDIVATVGGTCGFTSVKVNYVDPLDYLDNATSVATLHATESAPGVVDSLALRFGLEISKAEWDALETEYGIDDYGVMLFRTSEAGLSSVLSVEDYYLLDEVTIASTGNAFAPSLINGDTYRFTIQINIRSLANYNVYYCAAPYIEIDGDIHFLEEKRESVKHLAANYTGNDLSEETLNYLAANR